MHTPKSKRITVRTPAIDKEQSREKKMPEHIKIHQPSIKNNQEKKKTIT